MKKNRIYLILFLLINFSVSAHAGEKSVEELSKELANPLAQIWNLSFLYNHTHISGDLVKGSHDVDTLFFQPVLPIPLEGGYTFFARPVITYIHGPTAVEYTPAGSVGKEDRSSFGDTVLLMGFGKVNKIGWSWGGGATFIFPTSQNDLLGSHQYQAGPTALLLWTNEKWAVGTHIQHWWGFADDGKSDDDPVIKAAHDKNLNHTDMQYFIVRNLPDAWQLRTSPHITYDWSARSGERLTLPIGIGVGKMVKMGRMPVMLMMEYQKSVVKPDDVANDTTLMFQVNFIIKNPFGSM